MKSEKEILYVTIIIAIAHCEMSKNQDEIEREEDENIMICSECAFSIKSLITQSNILHWVLDHNCEFEKRFVMGIELMEKGAKAAGYDITGIKERINQGDDKIFQKLL